MSVIRNCKAAASFEGVLLSIRLASWIQKHARVTVRTI